MDDFDRLVGSMTRAQIQASAESLLRVLEKPDKNGGTFADTSGRLPAMSAAVSAAALLAAAVTSSPPRRKSAPLVARWA